MTSDQKWETVFQSTGETRDLYGPGATIITLGPMFPSTIKVDGASITLNADGTWEGDREAFLTAVANAKMDLTGLAMPILWLIVRALREET